MNRGQVALADGNKYFNRFGTTIVQTVQILAEILHGERFEQPWRGEAWLDYHALSTQCERAGSGRSPVRGSHPTQLRELFQVQVDLVAHPDAVLGRQPDQGALR